MFEASMIFFGIVICALALIVALVICINIAEQRLERLSGLISTKGVDKQSLGLHIYETALSNRRALRRDHLNIDDDVWPEIYEALADAAIAGLEVYPDAES